MKLLAMSLFACGVIFLILGFTLLFTRGAVDLYFHTRYVVLSPWNLFAATVVFLIGGSVATFLPHP